MTTQEVLEEAQREYDSLNRQIQQYRREHQIACEITLSKEAQIVELKKQIGVLEFQLSQRPSRDRLQDRVTPLMFLLYTAVVFIVGMVAGRGR